MRIYSGHDVTVLMSVYKNTILEEFLLALESITVKQTISPKSVVIVVDGPVDSTMQRMLKETSDIVNVIFLQENSGLANALSIGLSYVDTDLVVRMDSDDISRPFRIEMQLEKFNSCDELGVLGGSVREFSLIPGDGNLVREMPESDADIRDFLKMRNPFNHPTVMFKKDVVVKAGSYQEMGLFEDYFLWARIALNHDVKLLNVTNVLVDMRAGEGMYARRGGKGYLLTAFRLRVFMLQMGLAGFTDFVQGMTVNFLSILLPTKLRKTVYSNFLRGKVD
ncbi:glycosyltransferase [Weissella confusa]|uniref:glycosyltransferase n=1 Tax=Weissella TaxID=46255 RepID=UPI0018F11F05|nr:MULTISPECIES: glycosyltransferase [Weissella]MBJ7620272.1 glycosyltransferase [Weissella confusa]MBJ7667821.1 glycosyltransferase [Weissella confusa]MBJ7683088.1 glycosyltransferase [Weissella confusa]MBJ7685275.1 glycosyltransferase [Weissella confusa]MBJ7702565.1 glycosyltransferase [Weissella confusa]